MSFLNTLIPTFTRAEANGGPGASRRPRYEVEETENLYALTVYLPGVAKEGLEIADENGELRITGRRAARPAEGQVVLHRETSDLPYELVLAHDNAVDAEKISAKLEDGVLRLALAKSDSAKPRKITVS